MNNNYVLLLGFTLFTISTVEAVTPQQEFSNEYECLIGHPILQNMDNIIQEREKYNYWKEATTDNTQLADAPSSVSVPTPAATGNVNTCSDNTNFKFGAGKYDITGPWAGRKQAGLETPFPGLKGIHTRTYARSFIISDSCSMNKVIITNVDKSFIHKNVRDDVIQKIIEDPTLANKFDPNAWMLQATHTHSATGGTSNHIPYSMTSLGQEKDTLAVLSDGIYQSIKIAYQRYDNADSTGKIELGMEELINASVNRSVKSYYENAEADRNKFLNNNQKDITTNKLFTQLNLKDSNNNLKGIMNWFAIHPTAGMTVPVGLTNPDSQADYDYVSGDTKGYSALTYENLMSTLDEDFVAGFFNSDSGDVIPVRFVNSDEEGASVKPKDYFPPVFKETLGDQFSPALGNITFNAISHIRTALTLAHEANEPQFVKGRVDFRLEYINLEDFEVTDSFVLNSMKHDESLDTDIKKTCDPAVGFSSIAATAFGDNQVCSSTTDTPNFNLFDLIQSVISPKNDQGAANPIGLFFNAEGCNHLPPSNIVPAPDWSCHAEKPIISGLGSKGTLYTVARLPVQIIKVGNIAFIGVPFEVTTMAGRRIRESALDILKKDGVDYVVLAGYANDYASYLATREEYATQNYESAFTNYGPWANAAIQQASREISQRMINQQEQAPYQLGNLASSADHTLEYPTFGAKLGYATDQTDWFTTFAQVIKNVNAFYKQGDRVEFSYHSGNPNNDTYLGDSYFVIERKVNGAWEKVADDTSINTVLRWKSDVLLGLTFLFDTYRSRVTVRWEVPYNAQSGIYRIRYKTKARKDGNVFEEYYSQSNEFKISGEASACSYKS